MRKSVFLIGLLGMALSVVPITGCQNGKKDTYDKSGKLKVSMRNLYFGGYAKGDEYIDKVEEQFGLSFSLDSYDWANWTTQVNSQVNSRNLPDVFHANVDSYNFANTYKFWAEDKLLKPLPDDLSKWPNLQAMIQNTSNVESLKLDGKLYGIPIAKDTTDYSTDFSPFTYIYRRDWAKKYGVYQENDEYTWDQFKALLDKFSKELKSTNRYALGDVEWGFPSITNFYKQVPHCFAQDENGKYVNNYTTDAYIQGLEESKQFYLNGWYYPSQNTARDGDLNTKYYSGQVGVFYENLSYSNYVTLKNKYKNSFPNSTDADLADAMAIMKIKGPDGKYVLEGTDNWFSMTFFDSRISDEKLEKILNLYDWLLSPEGTEFSIYGEKDVDYYKDDKGNITLNEYSWTQTSPGKYAEKVNGAKYLRYMVSLGYDTLTYDPLTDKDAVDYLASWDKEMKQAKADGTLKVLKESAEVMWLTSPKKAKNSGLMRTNALKYVMQYIYSSGITSIDAYKKSFGSIWTEVLKEINDTLGK